MKVLSTYMYKIKLLKSGEKKGQGFLPFLEDINPVHYQIAGL